MNHQYAGTNDREQLGKYSWYNENSGGKTHEVKKKLPNGYGLYDMSGNAAEWCWNIYINDTPEGGQDPTGATNDKKQIRIHRGGSFAAGGDHNYLRSLKCTYRNYDDEYTLQKYIGLRLVCRRQ